MPQNRDTLFLKIAIKNGLLDTARGESILSTIAQRKEIGVEKHAWDVAVELDLMSEVDAKKIHDAVDRAVPPEKIAGFLLEAPIGKGAVGTVYRAKQVSLDKRVAVKLLHPKHTAEERFVADFLREAKAVAQLNHPNIVHAIDAGTAEGRPYFAMEYVDGETLRQKLERRGKLSAGETLEIAQQIAAGLAHAHGSGLLHRDIKPDNILIGNDGRTRIADLGLAIPVDDAELLAAEHKKQGTPFYLSPEAAQSGDLDARSDLYSFGALLYHCLSGKPVFTGGTVKEILTKHVHQDPVPVAEAAGGASAIDAVVMKLLAKSPEDRYQTASEVVLALAAAAKEGPPSRRAPGAAPKSRKKTPVAARSGGTPAASGRKKTAEPRIPIATSAPPRSRMTPRRSTNTASMVGLGVGALISIVFVISAVSKSGAAVNAPTGDEEHRANLEARAELIIERRIENWKKEHAKQERLAREAGERSANNPQTDELRRRALQNALRNFPDREAAVSIIAQIEKVDAETRAARIAGPAELLEDAKALVAEGQLWTAYLLLDDRKREARKDQEMNQTIEEFLSDLDGQIETRVLADLTEAKASLARKDFTGALAKANGIGRYADPKSVAKGEELAQQIEKEQAEYALAESKRRLGEEKRRYATVFSQFRTAAMNREFKEAISAAIELQAEMSTDEVRNRLETDLTAFALLDQFNKDALAHLEDTKAEGKSVKLELKPIGDAPRGRRYTCKIDHVEGNNVFIEVDRAVFPIAVDKITDQTIFDLVLAKHGESSPNYLVPLGVLFLYRGNFDIAKSHFDLSESAGTTPDTWLEHLEYVKKLNP